MIVPLVRQAGTPEIIDRHPGRDSQQGLEEGSPLCRLEDTALEKLRSRQHGFILAKQRHAHQWLDLSFEGEAQDLSGRALRIHQCGQEDIGIDDEAHKRMIAYMQSEGNLPRLSPRPS